MKYPFAVMAILSMIIIGMVMHTPFGWVTAVEIDFWGGKEDNARIANEYFHLSEQPSLLYLDPGDAPYFFRANSSCRYICSLPVQRDAPNWNLQGLDAYHNNYACILNYTGDYIILDNKWFNTSYHWELKEKLDREYTIVYNRSWDIYRRNL